MTSPASAKGRPVTSASPAAKAACQPTATRTRGAPPTASPSPTDGSVIVACPWAYFEGRLVRFEEATISIATHSLHYGTAVFEGIRAYGQADGGLAVLLLREHYERFLRNGRLLRSHPAESVDELIDVTVELLRRQGRAEDIYVRPILYKSARSLRLQLSGLDERVAIYAFPMGDYVPTTGLRIAISGWQRVNDNAIPARGKITGSYVNACLAVEDAHAGGYEEAVMLTADGHVAEASSANLFVVRGREIVTPPVADDVLPGITRDAIMEIAHDAGYSVHERKVDRTELYVADEVFLTGTGAQVAPVASIDSRPIGHGPVPGRVARDLQDRYFAAVRGRDPRYAHWLTRIDL
jgi:branched-chain amino acid aminotransferase